MSWLRHLSAFSDFLQFEEPKKPVVLVAGYGWAAHSFLKNISMNKYDIKVISQREKRLNQNRMIGDLIPSYTEPVDVKIFQDTCVRIDKQNKTLYCAENAYSYDYLVVATGSEVNDFGIQGVKEYCTMCKTPDDIESLRKSQKQKAVILGAGPTGIELACSLYKKGVQSIQIVEGADYLLPGFSDAFRQRVFQHLSRTNIQFHFQCPISKITKDTVVTKNTVIPYSSEDELIWTCGIRPVEFARQIEPKGIFVNDTLEYSPAIYVLGDSCKNKGPPTAQNASQQGVYLAELFNTNFKNKEPYQFKEIGRCLNLGDGFLFEIYGFIFFFPHLDWAELIWMLSK